MHGDTGPNTVTLLPSCVATSTHYTSHEHKESDSSSDISIENQFEADLVATVNTEIETDSEEDQAVNCDQQEDNSDLNQGVVSSLTLNDEQELKSKLACALRRTLGYYPELSELDKIKHSGDRQSNTYKYLTCFFRGKVLSCRTKIQLEMVELEKRNAKKTHAYKKLSKETKTLTILIAHLA
jgi:hypothetical protein